MTETVHQSVTEAAPELDLENGTPRLDAETARALAALATVPAAWNVAALEAELLKRGRHVAWTNDVRARSAAADDDLAEVIATAIHGSGSELNDEAFLDDVLDFMRVSRDWQDLLRLVPKAPDLSPTVAAGALDAAQAEILSVMHGAGIQELSYTKERDFYRSLAPQTRERTDGPMVTPDEKKLSEAIDALLAEGQGWSQMANQWIQRDRHSTDAISALGGAVGIVNIGRDITARATALNEQILAANNDRQRLGLNFTWEGSSGLGASPRALAPTVR